MNRKYLIAANWKMNPVPSGALEAGSPYFSPENVEVFVFPSFPFVPTCVAAHIPTGGQWGHPEESGAHTGDVSMRMLKDAGCIAVLCGHSERRVQHGETNAFVSAQVASALKHGLHPIVCVGEQKEERENGKAKEVVRNQLSTIPLSFQVTVAYEPVWAIGTGVSASLEQIEEMHAFIRSLFPELEQEKTRILYGGSLQEENAKDILNLPNVDGALVGSASLKPAAFRKIVEAASLLSS